MDSGITIEVASVSDATAIAFVLRYTLDHDLPYLPKLHTGEEDLEFIRDKVLPACTVLVAKVNDEVVGFTAFRAGWLIHLYILPAHQGNGIGGRLLSHAMEENEELQLWTLQKNVRARKFYEARGFHVVELTDGEGNEEKEPDVRYLWRKD